MCQPRGATRATVRSTSTGVGRASEVGDEVDPRAPNTGFVELGDLGVGRRVVDHGHASVATVAAPERVEQRGVVGAVAARLHEHGPRQPEALLEAREVIDAGVGRRVAAGGREREAMGGPEHVAVGVARRRWWLELSRRVRVGMRWRDRALHHSLAKTMPSMSLRAVRMIPARSTTGLPSTIVSCTAASNVPVGCSTDTVSPPSCTATSAAGSFREQRSGGHAHRPEHTDGVVATVGDEGAGGDRAARPRCRHQGQLGHRGGRHVAEVHERPGRQAYLLEGLAEAGVRLELGAGLVAGDVEGAGAQDDHRHAVVDQGDGQAAHLVHGAARRQEGAAGRAGDALEVQPDGGGGAGHPGDRRGAVVAGPAVAQRHRGGGQAPGVEHADADGRRVAGRWLDQATLEREGGHAGEEVAAVLPIGDHRPIDDHLEEVVVDVAATVPVGAGPTTATLLVSGWAPPMPSIWRSSGEPMTSEQQPVTGRPVGRQVVGQEVQALRRPAPHDHAADAVTHGASVHDVHMIVDNAGTWRPCLRCPVRLATVPACEHGPDDRVPDRPVLVPALGLVPRRVGGDLDDAA